MPRPRQGSRQPDRRSTARLRAWHGHRELGPPAAGTRRTTEDARYTYGHDPQTSVSLLLDDGTGSQGTNADSVKATYGYTPYGKADDALTHGDTQPLEPINPFRYIGKYHDAATGSVDMGARRFSPDLGRFYQRDRYYGALADLSLTLDPLTGNRYAYAAGRPTGYIEDDGHAFCNTRGECESPYQNTAADDTGGGSSGPDPYYTDGWAAPYLADGSGGGNGSGNAPSPSPSPQPSPTPPTGPGDDSGLPGAPLAMGIAGGCWGQVGLSSCAFSAIGGYYKGKGTQLKQHSTSKFFENAERAQMNRGSYLATRPHLVKMMISSYNYETRAPNYGLKAKRSFHLVRWR